MSSDAEPNIEGTLLDDHVIISNKEMQNQLESKGYGETRQGKFLLKPFEAFYFLFYKKLDLSRGKKKIGFEQMLSVCSKLDENALTKFLIYRDLRIRGYAVKDGGEPLDLMIALHARRSADSIAQFAAIRPQRPLIVVLTGTDLYRDLESDAVALRSLELASSLIVLNELGADALPPHVRGKATIELESARPIAPGRHAVRSFDVAVVGHLREVKDPQTVMRSLRCCPPTAACESGTLALRSSRRWAGRRGPPSAPTRVTAGWAVYRGPARAG